MANDKKRKKESKKNVFVLMDGAADLQCRQLEGKTPLEVAKKPGLDFFVLNGRMGYMYPLKENVAPESDSAITTILGYKPFVESRGVIEAIGEGIDFSRGDLILRTNFATIDDLKNKEIIDRRAGRNLTSKELKELEKAINENVKLPYEFEFFATSQHRGVLVIRGGFSDNISNTDPAYGSSVVKRGNTKLLQSRPLDDEEDSKLAANLINSFSEKVYEVLNDHPINRNRKEKGLLPANILLLRDAGSEKPKFVKIRGRGICSAYTPLMKGIAKSVGMDLWKFKVPAIKGVDIYAYHEKLLKQACKNTRKMIAKNFKKYDNFFVHFMETDVPGHDNKPFEKIKMIEIIDKEFFSWLKKYKEKIHLVVFSDHVTASNLKVHTGDHVPVLVFDLDVKGDGLDNFCEKDALLGDLGKIYGKEFMGKVM